MTERMSEREQQQQHPKIVIEKKNKIEQER